MLARLDYHLPGLAEVAIETMVYLSLFLALICGNKYLPHVFPGVLPSLRLRWEAQAPSGKEEKKPRGGQQRMPKPHRDDARAVEAKGRRNKALRVVTDAAIETEAFADALLPFFKGPGALGSGDTMWLFRATEKEAPHRTVELLDALVQAGVGLDPGAYASAVSSLGDHQSDRAGTLLLALRRHHSPSVLFYTSLVQQCARNGRPRLAVASYEDMVAAGVEADALCYNAVIHACAETGLVDEATRMLKAMQGVHGLKPTLVTYNSLIHCCAKKGFGARALDFLQALQESGLEADLITYNTVCSALAKSGQVDAANKILDDMSGFGVAPDVITFNSVLSACAHASEWKRGLQLLARMRTSDVQPDVISYNTAIHACVKNGADEEAQQCWRDMEAEGLVATRITYNILIRSFVRRRNWDEALGVMQTMRKCGVQPDVVSFNTIISGFANQGEADRAAALLLHDMPKSGVHPDHFSFSAVLAVCAKEKKYAQAMELVAFFRKQRVQADAVLFKTLISICDRCDAWPMALTFFQEMSARMPIGAEVFTLMVRASTRRGEDDRARQLLQDMAQAGHRPPPVVSNLVREYRDDWRPRN